FEKLIKRITLGLILCAKNSPMILFNIILSATIIGVCTWLTEKRPDLAGFIVSLPLSTILVLFLTQVQYQYGTKAILLAKSISIAIRSTLVFFIQFILADKLKLSFWFAYGSGLSLLIIGFFFHKYLFSVLFR